MFADHPGIQTVHLYQIATQLSILPDLLEGLTVQRVSLSNGHQYGFGYFSSGFLPVVEGFPSAISNSSSVFLRLVETRSVAVAKEIT